MNNKPKYNPQIHHRRSIRLKGYDYSQAGLYFITICCENRECRFGNIVGAGFTPAQNSERAIEMVVPTMATELVAPTMELNEYGTIAYNEWIKLPERFSNFELDVFQIMPNHMHGIILLNNDVGAGFTPAQKGQPQGLPPAQKGQPQGLPLRISGDDNGAGVNPVRTTNATIGGIVGAYKSLVANACLEIFKSKNETMGKLWQRNYHEHIIRNERSYQTISEYIINNPAKWKDDKFFK